MRISYRKISWIFAAIMVAASVLYSCEPIPPVDKPDQEQTPGEGDGTGNEDTPGGGDNPGSGGDAGAENP